MANVAAPPRRTACHVGVLSLDAVRRLKKGRKRKSGRGGTDKGARNWSHGRTAGDTGRQATPPRLAAGILMLVVCGCRANPRVSEMRRRWRKENKRIP